MTEPLLALKGLTKHYKEFSLQDASFEIQPGTLMGLIGPNGAGKTTLLKAILGLVRLDGGSVRLAGLDLATQDAALKQRIAYVPDEPRFAPGARLQTLMEVHAPFYPDFDARRWQGLMEDFGLDPRKKARELSLGQRTRFALTLALSRDPDLLVLDEPTTGLDPVFRRELIQRLTARLTERNAILFSTHITSDLERRADHVTLLSKGRVRFSLTQDDLRERWALVKGGLDLLDSEVRASFQGLRETPHGFEALVDDADQARSRFEGLALVERASLEDILVLMGGPAHA